MGQGTERDGIPHVAQCQANWELPWTSGEAGFHRREVQMGRAVGAGVADGELL